MVIISSKCHGLFLLNLPGKGQGRKKSRQQRKQSERENGRKTLRWVPLWLWLPPCINGNTIMPLVFQSGFFFSFFFCLSSGNKRWACGQLEDLPGQRQENQGEKEQVLPQTPESQDGTERMMLKNWTLKLTIVKTPVLCILTSSSSQPCVLNHRDTSSPWPT